jgi:hypothetical protein
MRQWHSFDQLNAWLVERCRVLWDEIRHPEYKHFNVLEMLEQERTEMMPMPQYSIGADRLASGGDFSPPRWPLKVLHLWPTWQIWLVKKRCTTV